MSHILFRNDFLVVQGELGEIQVHSSGSIGGTSPLPLEVTEPKVFRNMNILLIVQNNGKQRIISENFHLEQFVDNDKKTTWKFDSWETWYTLVNVFASLGYSFSDEPMNQHFGTNHIIDGWLNQLLKHE